MTETIVARQVASAPSATRRWSPARVAGTVVIGAWAGLFWFLWLSGRDAFYLSERTSWVVPVAAVILAAATVGRLISARSPNPESIRRRELAIMAAMVLPVLLVTVLPPATLGTFSAGKRAGYAGAGPAASAADIASGELTLVDVAAAQTTPEGERALAARAGEGVEFVGFVARYPDTPPDELMLTRYVVSCCVADATVAAVRVVNVTPGAFADNEWIEVTGTIYPIGREVIVNAASISAVERPDRPYLTG